MDILTLSYFIDICESKNISHAAKKHSISRQALSKMLIKLEDELGVTLLVRKKSGIVPTEEGEVLYRLAKNVIQSIDNAVDEIHAIHSRRKKILQVGYDYIATHLWAANHQQQFMLENPDIDVHMHLMRPDQLLLELEKNHLDLAITSAKGDEQHFDNHLLMQFPLCVLMAKDDALARKQPFELQSLQNRKVLLPPGHNQFFEYVFTFLKKKHIEVEYHHILSHEPIAIMQMVREKHMLYFTTNNFIKFIDMQGELTLRPFPLENGYECPTRDIYAITPRDFVSNTERQKYLGFLQDNIISLSNSSAD